MKDYRPGPLATVAVESTQDGPTLVFVRNFRHPVTAVWAALTDPDQLDQWAPFTADRDLAALGDATLTMIDGVAREELTIVVTLVEPPTRLQYTWGTKVLRWELEPTDSGTRLTLRHTVESPDWLSQVAAGWHICLDVADLLLTGRPIGPIRGQEAQQYGWTELNDAYLATTKDRGDPAKD